jgi:PAS domain-containing protein
MMAAISEAIRTKRTFELEHQVMQLDGTIGWTFSRAIPLLDPQGEIVEWLGAASDVTTRKRAELSAAFLAMVSHNLTEATSVEEIIQTIGEQLHRHLQISICAFVEINESAGLATVTHCWHQTNEPSLVGVYHLPEFVTAEFFQAAKLGQPFIVRDVKTDPRIVNPDRLAPLKIGSLVNIPLIRDGEWKFTLGIYHQTPYNWRTDEIELMRELANRIWTKLERTRVEKALRESEEKYRSLFTFIDEGFNLLEMISDESGRPVDFRILETNPAWEKQTGLTDATGKTLSEIAPDFEQQWLDFYSDVLVSGRGQRTEYYTASVDRWYTVYASRIGGAGSRQLVVVFNDIMSRPAIFVVDPALCVMCFELLQRLLYEDLSDVVWYFLPVRRFLSSRFSCLVPRFLSCWKFFSSKSCAFCRPMCDCLRWIRMSKR